VTVISEQKKDQAITCRLWDERSLTRVQRAIPDMFAAPAAGDALDRRLLSSIASVSDTWIKSGMKEIIAARQTGHDHQQLQHAWDDVQIAAREAILRRMTDAISDSQQLAAVDQTMLDLALAQSAYDEWFSAISRDSRPAHGTGISPDTHHAGQK
jgi:hypothetical protein